MSIQKNELKKIRYLKALPEKRITCAVILFNFENEVLLVKPSYKPGWQLPGGIVEKHESIINGLLREIKEEIGLKIKIKKCIVIEHLVRKIGNYTDELIQFIFLGEKMTKQKINSLKIDNNEIIDFKFVSLNQAYKLLSPEMSGRLKNLQSDFTKQIFTENSKRAL